MFICNSLLYNHKHEKHSIPRTFQTTFYAELTLKTKIMRILKLHLKNFRSYQDITIDFNGDFNTIIGRNDVGKSTILEALDVFFDGGTVPLTIDDLRVDAPLADRNIVIGVTFKVEPNKQYDLDAGNLTTLEHEYLLDKDGNLQIEKVWDCSSKSITARSLSTFIVANYFSAYAEAPLITQTQPKLKGLCETKGVVLPEGFDGRYSSSYRNALYKHLLDKSTREIKISIEKEDAKKIYEKLHNEFPIFALFQADRQNKDTDKDIQDPLKVITRTAIKKVENEFKKIVEKITEDVEAIGINTISKLSELDSNIANELTPKVKTKALDSIFNFSFDSDRGIPLNKRGSGVRRLIMLSYFRAEAESSNNCDIIFAIEEPETAQHPDYQIKLIEALREISLSIGHQVIITTHSPGIAKMCDNNELILIENGPNGPFVVADKNKMEEIRKTMGLLPDLNKLVLCVEGDTDRQFFNNIGKIPELKAIFDITKIPIIALHGSNLESWVNNNYLKGSNVVQFHIYDSDKGSGANENRYKPFVDEVNNQSDNSFAVLTNKREIENYIPFETYKKFFKDIDGWNSVERDQDTSDFPNFIHQKLRAKYKKEADVKRVINGRVSQELTKEHFEQINAWDEVQNWFHKMAELYEG